MDLRRAALKEGLKEGLILGVAAVILGVAGLSPSLTWIPEALLLALFVLVPVTVLAFAGYHAGALGASIAGAIGGCAGGLTYVAFGKPALNVFVGTVAGAVGGAVIGAFAARFAKRQA
jgi:hypothetical protein